MMYKLLFAIIFVCLSNAYSQEDKDSSQTKGVNLEIAIHENQKTDSLVFTDFGIIGYPYIFYSPESKLAVGAGGLMFFRTAANKELKPSKVLLSVFYTTNKQYNLVLSPEIYFPGIDKFYFSSRLNFSNEVGRFFSVGNKTPDIDTVSEYLTQQFNVTLEIASKNLVFQNLHTGIIYEYANNTMIDKRKNPYFNNNVPGEDGGKIGGAGLSITFDHRNNIFYPSEGTYLKLQGVFYRKFFLSDFSFDKFIVDFRQFWEPLKTHIIAFQTYTHLSNGSPPFYRLAALGGSNRMRGYFEGRYRDRDYIVTQVEYRKIVWWRLGVNAFFSFGDVADKLSNFRLDEFKHSYGFGIRFVFDETEKINLRVDIGFAEKNTGIYFAMEEAF